MPPTRPAGLALARVRLACGRIAAGARGIVDAYRFGIAEGPHRNPWTPQYHREAVHVYGQCLPRQYQLDIARLFRDSANEIETWSIPLEMAEKYLIVISYMKEGSSAIFRWSRTEESMSGPLKAARSPGIDEVTPSVIRFDKLAELTTRVGVRQLERAALAVQQHATKQRSGTLSPVTLDHDQRELLKSVASGKQIARIAEELGYSERSTYRHLAELWKALGVHDRIEGVRKATAEGLLD